MAAPERVGPEPRKEGKGGGQGSGPIFWAPELPTASSPAPGGEETVGLQAALRGGRGMDTMTFTIRETGCPFSRGYRGLGPLRTATHRYPPHGWGHPPLESPPLPQL